MASAAWGRGGALNMSSGNGAAVTAGNDETGTNGNEVSNSNNSSGEGSGAAADSFVDSHRLEDTIEQQPFAPTFGMPPPHLAGLWAAGSPMLGANQVVMEPHMIVYPQTAPTTEMGAGPGIIPPPPLIQPGMMPLALPNSNPIDPLENIFGVFPCVKMKNLPKETTIDNICLFFSGLVLIDVVLADNVYNSDDSSDEETFVLFANPMDFQIGLQRNRQLLGTNYVEVSQGKRHEYYEAIAANISKKAEVTEKRADKEHITPLRKGHSYGGSNHHTNGKFQRGHHHSRTTGNSGGGIQHGDHSGYLRMRGLPFSAKQRDILQFFSGFDIVEDSVVFTFKSDGRSTGEAYVKFKSSEESKKAMAMNRQSIGSRYIELFIATMEEHTKSVIRMKNSRSHRS